MAHQILSKSRFVVLLAVVGCFMAASILLVYGVVDVGKVAAKALEGALTGKKLLFECIELVDVFLLATVFYIVALGLYELFIDDTIPVPAWLEIHTLDDLKFKLLGVVVTVLAVAFLGQVVAWDGERDLLGFGVSVASVIAALTFYGKKK